MLPDYSEFEEVPTASGFDDLDILIDQQRKFEAEVTRLEDELRQAKAQLTDVAERQIPDLMDEMGLEEFKTKSGFKVKVKKTLRLSIAGERKYPAIAWLEEHGHGAVVKRTVTVPFLVNQELAASELVTELGDRFGAVQKDAKVESQTLTSLIKKLMALGEDVPLETFGAYEQRIAKISV